MHDDHTPPAPDQILAEAVPPAAALEGAEAVSGEPPPSYIDSFKVHFEEGGFAVISDFALPSGAIRHRVRAGDALLTSRDMAALARALLAAAGY